MKNKISIQWFDELDSTNSEIQRRKDTLGNLSTIAAVNQTAGRGQRGNSWLVRKGENLTFSILLRFSPGELEAGRQSWISEASALGVLDYLRSEGVQCRIKWPNDIYYRNRKICGMLIENSISEGWLSDSIVGIGLNVNQKEFPASLVNPISMAIITSKEYSLKEELEKLCGFLAERYVKKEYSRLKSEYEENLYRIGEYHEYSDCSTGRSFIAKILGVTDEGLLRAETKEGELREFAFKEISYII